MIRKCLLKPLPISTCLEKVVIIGRVVMKGSGQGLSQDLETGCQKLAIVKFLGVQIFKGDHNILISTSNMYEFIKIKA